MDARCKELIDNRGKHEVFGPKALSKLKNCGK